MSDLVSRLGAALDRAGSLLGGEWRPTELAGCRLWLRASSGVSRTGPLVRAWRDRASGIVLCAPSLMDAPSFVAGHPLLGDRPAISFAAPGEHVAVESRELARLDALTLFLVLVPEGVGASTGFAVSLSDDGARAGVRVAPSNELCGWQHRYMPGRVCLLPGRPYVVALVRSLAWVSLVLDGVVVRRDRASDWHPGGVDLPRVVVGAPRPVGFRGAIAEVILHGRALTRSEIDRTSVELAQHYALVRPTSS